MISTFLHGCLLACTTRYHSIGHKVISVRCNPSRNAPLHHCWRFVRNTTTKIFRCDLKHLPYQCTIASCSDWHSSILHGRENLSETRLPRLRSEVVLFFGPLTEQTGNYSCSKQPPATRRQKASKMTDAKGFLLLLDNECDSLAFDQVTTMAAADVGTFALTIVHKIIEAEYTNCHINWIPPWKHTCQDWWVHTLQQPL